MNILQLQFNIVLNINNNNVSDHIYIFKYYIKIGYKKRWLVDDLDYIHITS